MGQSWVVLLVQTLIENTFSAEIELQFSSYNIVHEILEIQILLLPSLYLYTVILNELHCVIVNNNVHPIVKKKTRRWNAVRFDPKWLQNYQKWYESDVKMMT